MTAPSNACHTTSLSTTLSPDDTWRQKNNKNGYQAGSCTGGESVTVGRAFCIDILIKVFKLT